MQALQRFTAGQSQADSAVDNYVRTQLAGDDPKLYLATLGGGSIASLAGQDGTGAGAPRLLQRLPNGSVQAKGYTYAFDGLGRVETTRGTLTLEQGVRDPRLQREAGGADRRTTDDGGHIVGHRFNPPSEEFNLFAQDANFNRGAYRQLENEWAIALRDRRTVKVEWKFEYSGSSVRPDSLKVNYWVDGKPHERVFNNARGGR
ncbi:MAG: DNA/RNA non-specific endonuclease [Pseudomonadota bacterium]